MYSVRISVFIFANECTYKITPLHNLQFSTYDAINTEPRAKSRILSVRALRAAASLTRPRSNCAHLRNTAWRLAPGGGCSETPSPLCTDTAPFGVNCFTSEHYTEPKGTKMFPSVVRSNR